MREMRRKKQLLPPHEAEEILNDGSWGVLALIGDDTYPYGVPVNYVYVPYHERDTEGTQPTGRQSHLGAIFFHSAKEGHKIDAIRATAKASFTMVAQDTVVPEEFATHYKSVIAFGKVSLVEDEAEKREIIALLADKYNPGADEARDAEIAKDFTRLQIIRFDIEALSGKEALALAQARNRRTQ